MYLDFLVKIPSEKGKITTKPKGNAVYVNYEIRREYDKDKFLTYFPETELPEEKFDAIEADVARY